MADIDRFKRMLKDFGIGFTEEVEPGEGYRTVVIEPGKHKGAGGIFGLSNRIWFHPEDGSFVEWAVWRD